MMPRETTTVRVSRRTHSLLADMAAQEGRSVADLMDQLAERARRQRILEQYNARMEDVLRQSGESASWRQELALSEASAAEALADEPAYPLT